MASTQEMIGKTGTVVDLMAGIGLVAAEYRKMGYAVIASDMMTYSKWHLITQIMMDREPTFDKLKISSCYDNKYLSVLDYLNNLEPIEGYFFRVVFTSWNSSEWCGKSKVFFGGKCM